MIKTNEPYHIGVCSSCLIKECPNPKQNKNHPEQGCRDWTRYKKYNLPLFKLSFI